MHEVHPSGVLRRSSRERRHPGRPAQRVAFPPHPERQTMRRRAHVALCGHISHGETPDVDELNPLGTWRQTVCGRCREILDGRGVRGPDRHRIASLCQDLADLREKQLDPPMRRPVPGAHVDDMRHQTLTARRRSLTTGCQPGAGCRTRNRQPL